MKQPITILVVALVLSACNTDNYVTYSGFAQGTTYNIVANCAGDSLGDRIDSVFEEMDNTFSMFNPSSLVSRINRNETDRTTPLFDECFAIAETVNKATGGYYDITVKPLVDAWGFGPGEQQEIPCVECLMEYVGMDKVRISDGHIEKDDPRVQLDFSSVAKGLTVDRLAEMLETAGARDYMVYVGGEVRVKGVNAVGNPWRIGINKPAEGFNDDYQVVVTFNDTQKAIATSGNYRNWFTDEQGHRRVHTIDPKTGIPAIGNILSVSIVTSKCGLADAYATGLMASHNIENAKTILPETDYYILYTDENGETATLRSPGFPIADQ